MRSSPGSRVGVGFAFAIAAMLAAGACSRTPHFVPDQTGGGGTGGSSSSTSSTSTSSTSSSTSSSSGTGGGPAHPCIRIADCGTVDTECAHPTCEQGSCGVHLEPMGTVTKWQVPWDCKKNVCDGNGGVVQVTDDTDTPDDGNGCTTDTCDNGQPTHANAAAGATCGTKPNMTCDGAGHCTNCNNAAQCGAAGTCFTWTCDANQTCQQVFTPMGMNNPSGGIAHDCHRNVCDGKGGVTVVPDPTDEPLDPSTCMLGTCVGDMAATTPAPATVACFGGKCDGMGNCGSCSVDADCGAPEACATPKCIGGHCSAIFAPAGMTTPQQTSGDCSKNVCDGNGGVTTAPDDTDIPPDPDACNTAGCSNGAPTSTPIMVPSSNNPCIQDGCDPQSGVFHTPLPDNTACGGCSICVSAVCTDPCPAINCQCVGNVCGNCI